MNDNLKFTREEKSKLSKDLKVTKKDQVVLNDRVKEMEVKVESIECDLRQNKM